MFLTIDRFPLEKSTRELAKHLADFAGAGGYSRTIDGQEFKTISIQLQAYGLVKTQNLQTIKGGMALFWALTARGQQLMMALRAVRREST